ncbi:MAG: beta-hydroxyacyl-ACP dehydratase [Candidatus Omnitrophica bacterium]|nr:beta-hydroxyacyl-ACP dehydratase [Candidatus Omnitrophota bacterium]
MSGFSKKEVLALVPQQRPYRFIDEIHELNEDGIVASYTFKDDEFFYPAHFPGNPVTPGAVLLEAMAQAGVVAYGIYLCSLQMPREEIEKYTTVFTEANVEFTGIVKPGDKIIVKASKEYFRRMKMKAKAEVSLTDGKVVCSGTIAGMGIKTK